MELREIDVQVLDRFVGQRHDAGLVSFPSKNDVPGLVKGEVLQRQSRDLANVCSGIV